MTIAQTSTTSFKVELLQAVHNFGPTTPNTFKIALYTAAATINATTTVYTTGGEVATQSAAFTAAATQALSMVAGVIPVDLYYDLNGDGAITLADALGFQSLAAGTPLGYTPNPASIYTAIIATGQGLVVGYTAGGNTLVISTSPTSGNSAASIPTAYVSFSPATWPSASFTARGALIYNATQGNKSVAVLDFGADKTVANNTFQIVFPTADATSAIVRIS